MAKSLSKILNKQFVYCPYHNQIFTLNDTLKKAKAAKYNKGVEVLDTILVGILKSDCINADERRATKIILKQIQDLYNPKSIHEARSAKSLIEQNTKSKALSD